MVYSSSLLLVRVKNINPDQDLHDVLKLENDSFFSLTFFDEKKKTGELHWSKSFHHGKMNLLNFTRVEDIFILFTSSISSVGKFVECINEMIGGEISYTILKSPLDFKGTEDWGKIIPESENVRIDAFISVQLNFRYKNNIIYMKLYSNGIITYSMTNDMSIIDEVVKIAKKILETRK